MVRWITSLFLLFYATTGFSASHDYHTSKLDWGSAVRYWIDKFQPKINPTLRNLIANQVLYYSEKNKHSVELLVALITIESKFDTKAQSRHGAKGLTQVVAKWHPEKVQGRSLFLPEIGIEVGSKILKDCLISANGNERKALSCYSGKSGAKAVEYQNLVFNQRKRFLSILQESLEQQETLAESDALDSKNI